MLRLPQLDNVNKDIVRGLAVGALVAVLLLLVGIYIATS